MLTIPLIILYNIKTCILLQDWKGNLKMKKKYIIIVCAVMLAGVIAALLGILAGAGAPAVIGSQPDPKETVADFFDNLKTGEFQSAMENIANYDSLGFEKEGSELIELYKQTLLESYDVKITEPAGEVPENRLESLQGIEFTHIDCRLLVDAVSQKTSDAALEYMNDGYVIENDEQAMEFVYDALRECLGEPEQYLVTEHFDISLVFDGESWKMIISDELAAALFGYIESLSTEGVN